MSTEANKALVRHYRAIHNTNKLDALDEIVAKDIVSHNKLPGLPAGLEGRQTGTFCLTWTACRTYRRPLMI